MNSSSKSTTSSSAAAAKAVAAAKKTAGKKKNGGGANRSKAIHNYRIQQDLSDDTSDLVLGVITKKLAGTRFTVTIPDPSDRTMADPSGRSMVDKPLQKQKLIEVQAAALDKKAQRSLHAKDVQAEPGAFVAVCQSGRTYEIQLLLNNDSVRKFKNEGRIHPKFLGGGDDAAADCGIEFDYDASAEAMDAQVNAMLHHKNKNYARGIDVEKPVPLPVKSTKPVDLVGVDAVISEKVADNDDINVDDI